MCTPDSRQQHRKAPSCQRHPAAASWLRGDGARGLVHREHQPTGAARRGRGGERRSHRHRMHDVENHEAHGPAEGPTPAWSAGGRAGARSRSCQPRAARGSSSPAAQRCPARHECEIDSLTLRAGARGEPAEPTRMGADAARHPAPELLDGEGGPREEGQAPPRSPRLGTTPRGRPRSEPRKARGPLAAPAASGSGAGAPRRPEQHRARAGQRVAVVGLHQEGPVAEDLGGRTGSGGNHWHGLPALPAGAGSRTPRRGGSKRAPQRAPSVLPGRARVEPAGAHDARTVRLTPRQGHGQGFLTPSRQPATGRSATSVRQGGASREGGPARTDPCGARP